ncbi:hypothetical protein [Paenibacillus eucommiae]|uniref:Uncharacterized protein n=1 Tax=Paenibacillus eucommiae TaxID=1355755 RepID=A0ABS4J2Y8_9BACL|nr:hypothetical protein [Paenibacillus eucommiae]MBP1994221.1 hypothetical protein [Paenibacillus eucommiae]
MMVRKKSLTVEDFTNLLETMRMSHEKFFAENRTSWDTHLDRLGDYLNGNPQ